jgi:DNA-binding transcriptional LysR family regulator
VNGQFNSFEHNGVMNERRNVLTPDALAMIDAIARTGSFAAAAREIGKVPSALTYSVRHLEEALKVTLFDRTSRQAQLTPAGEELLHEARRLLQEMDAVVSRVCRVASGWETQLSIVCDEIISPEYVMELIQGFDALSDAGPHPTTSACTQLRLTHGVLAGTWEALISGQADLAIGVAGEPINPGNIEMRALGDVEFVFAVAPHHPLALAPEPLGDDVVLPHRAIAIADTAHRLEPITMNLLQGQNVLTVPDLRTKLLAHLKGLGCGFLPRPLAQAWVDQGLLLIKQGVRSNPKLKFQYAWHLERYSTSELGRGLRWWLDRLGHADVRHALLNRHSQDLRTAHSAGLAGNDLTGVRPTDLNNARAVCVRPGSNTGVLS